MRLFMFIVITNTYMYASFLNFNNNSAYFLRETQIIIITTLTIFIVGMVLGSLVGANNHFKSLKNQEKNLIQEIDKLLAEDSLSIELSSQAKEIHQSIENLKIQLSEIQKELKEVNIMSTYNKKIREMLLKNEKEALDAKKERKQMYEEEIQLLKDELEAENQKLSELSTIFVFKRSGNFRNASAYYEKNQRLNELNNEIIEANKFVVSSIMLNFLKVLFSFVNIYFLYRVIGEDVEIIESFMVNFNFFERYLQSEIGLLIDLLIVEFIIIFVISVVIGLLHNFKLMRDRKTTAILVFVYFAVIFVLSVF